MLGVLRGGAPGSLSLTNRATEISPVDDPGSSVFNRVQNFFSFSSG